MARRRTRKSIQKNHSEITGLLLIVAGLFSAISLAGVKAGAIGPYIDKGLRFALGKGALITPFVLIALGGLYIKSGRGVKYTPRFWALGAFFICMLAVMHHFAAPEGREILPESLAGGGGLAAGLVIFLARKIFGFYGGLIVVTGLGLCGLVVATRWSIRAALTTVAETARDGIAYTEGIIDKAGRFYNQEKDKSHESQARRETKVLDPVHEKPPNRKEGLPAAVAPAQEFPPVLHYNSAPKEQARSVPKQEQAWERQQPKADAPDSCPGSHQGRYILPPLSLLKPAPGSGDPAQIQEAVKKAKVLEETLASFNVKARVINISQGPAVTRFELEPAPGTKVSKFLNLSDDIALNLAAPGVRIEAPIPGKAAIGIEVPNKTVSSVPLRAVLESSDFRQARSPLTVALGKDIAGQTVVADLGKMPHLLVAGSTGSGKSVCVNAIIASILFRAAPEEVKFILVDPKVVELTNYNGLPHLLTPVVTEAKKAASALRWAVREMERRYELFAAAGVRDIGRYNEQIEKFPAGEGSSGTKLPFIIVIIDELADLMMVSPVDVEDAVCRLAQMARAAGIHMVLATQRPSVDVITGLIKANVPSRIAFAVSSQVDSRTILDMAGAEKLLGKGDMLFYPMGAPKPIRVQGAFISDGEVEALTAYIRKQAEDPEYLDEVTAIETGGKERTKDEPEFGDELLEDAIRIIMETKQASTSMLQRKFRIGYTRAARIIDLMEEMKIVGPSAGSKPRDILMTMEQVYARYFKNRKDQ